ncbi:MAG: acyltransferase family protein [Lachnospiraceae bacterium]
MKTTENLYTKERSTILKGIAILLMVWHHTFRATGFFEDYIISFDPFAMDQVVLFSQMVKFCVAVFVFVSGYGLYFAVTKCREEDTKYSVWTLSRLIELIISFAFVFLICFAVIGIFDPAELFDTYGSKGTTTAILYFLLNLLGLQSFFNTPNLNGAWWYISAAIFFIVVAPIAAGFIRKFGAVIAVGMVVMLPRIFTPIIREENSIYKYVLIYIIGMIMAREDLMNRWLAYCPTTNKKLGKLIKLVGLSVLFAIFYKVGTIVTPTQFWEINYTLLPLLSVLIGAEFIAVIPGIKQIFYFIGFYSLEIYLVHNYSRIYFKDFLYGSGYFLLSPLWMLLFGLAAGILLYYAKRILQIPRLIDFLQKKIQNSTLLSR